MNAISQKTSSRAFSSMKIIVFWLNFHWNMLARVQLTNNPALVQIMAWRRSGDKPLSETMMISLPTHISVTRPQWVNLLSTHIREEDDYITEDRFWCSKCKQVNHVSVRGCFFGVYVINGHSDTKWRRRSIKYSFYIHGKQLRYLTVLTYH